MSRTPSTTADTVGAGEMIEGPNDAVSIGRVQVGDILTIPGTSVHRCRVRMVRSAVPGVVWLYLAASTTGERLRGHVALPLNHSVLRHRTTAADSGRFPDD